MHLFIKKRGEVIVLNTTKKNLHHRVCSTLCRISSSGGVRAFLGWAVTSSLLPFSSQRNSKLPPAFEVLVKCSFFSGLKDCFVSRVVFCESRCR